MGERLYHFLGGAVRMFSHRMKTEWEVPYEEGPCVFVVNHTGSSGPINMFSKFPLRKQCHPWINDGILHAKTVPEYVRKDQWWKPGGFLEPLYKVTVPYIAAAVMPPILRGTPYIPVYNDQRIMLTLRQSIRVMQKDESIVIFPELPSRWMTHHEWISTGWLRLGELWYKANGRALKMYPVHIDRKKHVFKVAAPVWYDPARRFRDQERELAEALSKGLRGE